MTKCCLQRAQAHPRRVARVARQLEREVGTLLSTDPVRLPASTPSARDSPCLHVSQPVRCFEQPVCEVPEQVAAPSQRCPQPLCHRQGQEGERARFLLYQHGQLVLLACCPCTCSVTRAATRPCL